MPAIDVSKLDLYGILEVTVDATEKEIVRAYRQKARKCHPDKNPDNPHAVDLFHKLSKALEVLTDAAAKAAYDKIVKAKQAAEARNKLLDDKRKRFKEDLEARENAAQDNKMSDLEAASKLAAEIERLRKEGSTLLEQEQELLREELKQAKLYSQTELTVEITPKLRVKWKTKKSDESNGGYCYNKLKNLFDQYGTVLNLLVSQKKKGSAIVEFGSQKSAADAVRLESGHDDNPLSLTWLSGQPSSGDGCAFHTSTVTSDLPSLSERVPSQAAFSLDEVYQPMSSQDELYQPMSSQERDFESVVMMKMRQAQERQNLIEEMQKEEKPGNS